MTKEELHGIVADAVNDSELRSGEIPAIDLYVDQILNLVSSKLEQGSTRFHERQLTKTMINNYSKDGIITPVKGKKYTKEQIIQILCVYSLKNTLTINEIKRLLYGAYSAEDFGADDLVDIYDRYQDIKYANRAYGGKLLEELLGDNQLDIENDRDYVSAICAIVSLSAHLRNIARAMIDAKFPEPEQTPEEDKKEDKKEKKEKAEKPPKEKVQKEKPQKEKAPKEKKKKEEQTVSAE